MGNWSLPQAPLTVRAYPGAVKLGRRQFLIAGVGAGGRALAGPLAPDATASPRRFESPPPPATDPFTLGVASGDPDATSVVLWTRLAPDPLGGGGMPPGDVPVTVEVATDPGFASGMITQEATALEQYAHSVHVTISGLDPDSWYHYRFRLGDWTSAVGRTRTAPDPTVEPDSARIAVASCQNYRQGLYTAHRHLAAEGVDLVMWLGDYIYESGGRTPGPVRPHNSDQVTDLTGYRNRYASYKLDPDLQAAHAAAPWVVTWDDHEVDNNYAGDHSQDDDPVDVFRARRAAAYQAWYEHQPVRLPPPAGPDYAIHRTVRWGSLVTFLVLDSRQYRDAQPCGDGVAVECAERTGPRQMLGADQEAWLAAEVGAADTRWNALVQQVVFGYTPILGTLFNLDQWDGYAAARQRVTDLLAGGAGCPLVLSGDIHAFGFGDLLRSAEDTASPVIGAEIVSGSISSTPAVALEAIKGALLTDNPHIRYVNGANNGYVVATLSAETLSAEYRLVSTIAQPGGTISTATTQRVSCADFDRRPDTPTTTPPTVTPTTTTTTQHTPTTGAPAQPVKAAPRFTG